MSDRKAVITTAQVQEALAEMNTLKTEIGLPVLGTEFDKGARGKGFALYNATGSVVQSFDTKEAAFNLFSSFTEIGNVILGASHVKVLKPEPVKATVKKAADKPAE